MEQVWIKNEGKTEAFGENLPRQIPRGLA